jgi:predicted phage terminase large subunit-like protein
LARKLARDSLTSYIGYLDTGFEMAAHHGLIVEELERVERGDTENLMLMLPPGSAKSTYASVYFPAWYLGRNPKDSVIAASHTLDLAERFGRRVRNLVASRETANVFEVGIAADSSAAGRWDTDRGGEYFAAGVGGSITGRRADLGLIDDPVKSREDADSETKRESTWQWYVNDFLTRLKPGARQVLIMTRWHEDDLAGRLLARESERWRVVKVPMEAGADDPLGRSEGELLWPEWFTSNMVERAKADPRSWYALYQQEPRPMGGGEFKREWINYYDGSPDNLKSSTNRYMLVDAANEKKKTSDYTAIWVVGLGQDNNIYVLDIVQDKLSLTERAAEVMRLHRKWRPRGVRYERYGMHGDIEHIRYLQNQENYRFSIDEVAGATAKNDRIRRLIPYFEEGRMWFPNTLHRTQHDGVTRDLINTFVEQEYLAFPVAKHDDMIDALARIAEPDMHLTWPRPTEEPKETRYTNKRKTASVWSAM